jgi:hypothetical protein
MRSMCLAGLLFGAASVVGAQGTQQPPPPMSAALSSFSTTSVILNGRFIGAMWFPNATGTAGPARITIEYSQPHLRGRTMIGKDIKFDEMWRTGANLATQLRAEVDMMIGDLRVPAGIYSIFTIPGQNGWKLVISKQLFLWASAGYDQKNDLGRVDMKVRTLSEPLESLTFWLIPAAESYKVQDREATRSFSPPRGELRIAWDKYEASVGWSVIPPPPPASR